MCSHTSISSGSAANKGNHHRWEHTRSHIWTVCAVAVYLCFRMTSTRLWRGECVELCDDDMHGNFVKVCIRYSDVWCVCMRVCNECVFVCWLNSHTHLKAIDLKEGSSLWEKGELRAFVILGVHARVFGSGVSSRTTRRARQNDARLLRRNPSYFGIFFSAQRLYGIIIFTSLWKANKTECI